MFSALILDRSHLFRGPLNSWYQTLCHSLLPLDDPLGSDAPVAEAMTPLVALALDSSDRRESGADILEVDRLILGRFGAGSGVLLRGTSGSLMISLLLLGFVTSLSKCCIKDFLTLIRC